MFRYYTSAPETFRVRQSSSSAWIDYTLTICKHEDLPKSPVTIIMQRLLLQIPYARMDKYCERQYGALTRPRQRRCIPTRQFVCTVAASPQRMDRPGIADHPLSTPNRLARSSHRSPSGTVLFEGPRTRPAVNFDPDRPARRRRRRRRRCRRCRYRSFDCGRNNKRHVE